MNTNFNVLGHKINISKEAIKNDSKSVVDKKRIRAAIETLKKYKAAKENLDTKIVVNEKWYKSQHWDIMRQKEKNQDPEPVTGYLFNTLAGKHADAMDNYPAPNIIEREEDDIKEAESLTNIIPLVIEKNKFKKTYSRSWWYKLKQGFAVYGVFWNNELENGLGDIDVKKIDALNVVWEPGKEDIQESRNLFILSSEDNDLLEEEYSHIKGKLKQDSTINIKQYANDNESDLDNKTVVVDWYYKKRNSAGKKILHLTKFANEIVLESTEDHPELQETGIYEHGMYPVHIDVLFPEEGTVTGFGFIDIVKNPQMYIDKLDQIISKNALISGKQRHFVKNSGSVNETELTDLSKDIVHVDGEIEQNVKSFQGLPLNPFIVNHRQSKIEELKEIAAENQFNRGEGGKGVTAASAIQALQEAGNKVSRDMIQEAYGTYTDIIYMCIELIRQFYTEDRKFRIEGPDGQAKYTRYNNQGLQPQELGKLYENEGMIPDPENAESFIPDPEYQAKFRRPVFDIRIQPERANPFSRLAQNEMSKEMFNMGFFNPQRALEALIAIEMMSFEGKEKTIQKINENNKIYQQMQQMQQTMDKMSQVIEKTTGKNPMSMEQ